MYRGRFSAIDGFAGGFVPNRAQSDGMKPSGAQPIRRDLRFLIGDGVAWAVMTGAGEWQFVLFALAIGMGEVASGLLATIPMFIGAVLQLVTPWGARWVGSLRRWTAFCAGVQMASLLPLVIGAWIGSMPW